MANYAKCFLLTVVFCMFFIAGCQTTTAIYKGALAEKNTVFVLQEAVKKNLSWQDLYVSLDFQVDQQGDDLELNGYFSFADYPQMNLARVDRFKLQVFLLNKDNVVLEYYDLYRTVGYDLDERVAFKKTLKSLTGVTAISFGYAGEFIEELGRREFVWKLPRRSH